MAGFALFRALLGDSPRAMDALFDVLERGTSSELKRSLSREHARALERSALLVLQILGQLCAKGTLFALHGSQQIFELLLRVDPVSHYCQAMLHLVHYVNLESPEPHALCAIRVVWLLCHNIADKVRKREKKKKKKKRKVSEQQMRPLPFQHTVNSPS